MWGVLVDLKAKQTRQRQRDLRDTQAIFLDVFFYVTSKENRNYSELYCSELNPENTIDPQAVNNLSPYLYIYIYIYYS